MALTDSERIFLRPIIMDFVNSLDPNILEDPGNAEEKLMLAIRKIAPVLTNEQAKSIVEDATPKCDVPKTIKERENLTDKMMGYIAERVKH